jgi:hypothetical protein
VFAISGVNDGGVIAEIITLPSTGYITWM